MYSLSIILPFIDEINSLNKTLNIINSKNKEKKEFLIITSKKKTPPKLIKKICRLNKKYKIKILYFGRMWGGVFFGRRRRKFPHFALFFRCIFIMENFQILT